MAASVTLIHARHRVVRAEANWGRWIARCGWCPSAMWLNPGAPSFECDTCYEKTEIIWPSDEMVQGVERLLMMRRDVTTRNWLPGETLIDLMVENGQHGIFDRADGSLAVEEGRIRMDSLPGATEPMKAVG